jgi:ligand-binding SRPBCC domain-containing protein
MSYLLERALFIPKPRAEVFAFFAEAANLERITPSFLKFHILTPGPIPMRAGTLIDYQLRLHGVPLRWRTLIESFDPISSFTDVQLKGPYRRWHHHHTFEDAPGGTLMRDRVDYDLGFGWIGNIVHALFVRRSVEQIFDYRNKTIMEIFGEASAK